MEICSSCLRLLVVGVLVITVVSSASVQVSKIKRAVSAESLASSTNLASSSNGGAKVCHHRTPCGWAVYIPFTRTVDYFMKNTCVCSKGKVCLRTDDDLSVSAYVYRCRVEANPNEADTEPPTSAPNPS